MAGDYSRSSFNPLKHFSGVRMQQGRVQLDADWNEQVDIATHFTRTATLDLIGPYGAPAANAGFAISVVNGSLMIGPGRMYVNGILCENATTVTMGSPLPAAASAGGGGSQPPQENQPSMDIVIVRSPQIVLNQGSSNAQPDLPGAAPPTTPGLYTIYLDVWEREITALDDPSILEVALGGVDTATRTRVVWQVKWMPYAGSCSPNFATLLPPSSGALQAQAQPDAGAATPCAVPAQAGYTSLENQLYRVEIHSPGIAGTATFKWSRDNGSVVAAVQSQPAPNQLVVSTLGRDQVLGFAGGQWVELTDDTHILTGKPGVLVALTLAAMNGQSPTLTFTPPADGSANLANFPLNPIVRRWDEAAAGPALAADNAVGLQAATWLALENGVQVQFAAGGTYKTGDYWLIPARTATVLSSPTVLWPADSGGNPLPEPALGIAHSHACLATASLDAKAGWSVVCDCRSIFGTASVPKGLHVVDVRTLQPAGELVNDSLVPLATFLNGLKIVCDGALDPATLKLATFFATLDLPLTGADTISSGLYPAAVPSKLMASVAVGDSGNVSAVWIPTPQARAYIYEQMASFAAVTMNQGQALVSVTLKGSFVWGAGATTALVNGPAFGTPAGGGVGLALPSGDGRRGGDFQTWFWVPGYCDMGFPQGWVPFTKSWSVAGPDGSGDSVVVGQMTHASYNEMLALPKSDVTARKLYCSPVQIAPGSNVFAYVPTALERGGNFSTFGSPIINPATNSPFPGNAIPVPGAAGGVFAWRIRGFDNPTVGYGYGYGYGYGQTGGVGAELI